MLAERFPRTLIEQHLLPFDQYCPYPRIADREQWASLPPDVAKRIIERAEQYLDFDWPALTAARYMDFARDGNRSRYEGIYFPRRVVIGSLVLGECVENKGRFLDQIINGIWAICEETSWVVPAHNGQASREPLPTASDVNVDLFAAETAAHLSWVHYLVGSSLDAVSPVITARIRQEVETRVLDRFITAEMHWMGFHGRPVNNWNPWCTSNCLASMLLLEPDARRRVDAVEHSLKILDNWLSGYTPDGGCDEGPGYWNVAGGALFDCLELLFGASSGDLSAYDDPLIGEIGRYIARVHISGDYFVNFADANARVAPDGRMVYRYGKRIGDPDMLALGAFAHARSNYLTSANWRASFHRALPEIFEWQELSSAESEAPYIRDSWMEGIQAMIARERAGSDRGLYLAAKGGHNSESHNHNDIGSFIIYADGQPMLIDAGVGAYTRETFGPNRYSLWTMQSAYHNLPTVNGIMQSPGGQFKARDVSYHADEHLAELSLNIAGAYPEEAQIEKWQRTFRLHRGQNSAKKAFVEVIDDFAIREPTSDVVLSLMAAHEPTIDGDIVIRDAEGNGISIEYDTTSLTAEVEPIEITDGRLAGAWGNRLYRVLLRAREQVTGGVWQMRMRMA